MLYKLLKLDTLNTYVHIFKLFKTNKHSDFVGLIPPLLVGREMAQIYFKCHEHYRRSFVRQFQGNMIDIDLYYLKYLVE